MCHETVTFKEQGMFRSVLLSVPILCVAKCLSKFFRVPFRDYHCVKGMSLPIFFLLGALTVNIMIFSFDIQVSGNSGLTAGIPTAQTAFAPVQEYAQHVIKSGSLYCRLFYNTGC